MSASVLLTQLPDELFQRLQEAATLHQHSIEQEALLCLHKVLMPISTTEERGVRTHDYRQKLVSDEGRLADAIKRLEEGDPCLL